MKYNKFYKALDWDNDYYDDYFTSYKEAIEHIKNLYKSGSEKLRIYSEKETYEDDEPTGDFYDENLEYYFNVSDLDTTKKTEIDEAFNKSILINHFKL